MIKSTLFAFTLVAAPLAVAAQQAAPAPYVAAVEMAEGTIQSVDLENNTFTLQVGERSIDVTVGPSTSYVQDGEASTREAVLKRGAKVTVTHDGGRASKVESKG